MTTDIPFRIFVSYRRKDAAGHVGWLCECLSRQPFGQQIFRDVAAIGAGAAWRKVIDEAVRASDAFICIFGPSWTSLLQEKRRKGEEDIALREISSALMSELEGRREVIPVLVWDADLPAKEDLPEELAALWEQHLVRLRDDHWHDDLQPLFTSLADLFEKKKKLWPPPVARLTGEEIVQRSWNLLNPPLMMGRSGNLSGKLMTADLESGAWRHQKYEVRYESSQVASNWFPVSEFLSRLEERGEWPPT